MRRKLQMAVLTAVVAPALSAQTPPAAQPQANPCAAPEFSQFDFWVGSWDVYGPRGKQVGTSLIEKVYGCGVRENWKPFTPADGGSLNIYVPATKKWEQFWIDRSGSRAYFTGSWNGSAMVMTGDWGAPTRMTYTPNTDGSVRQLVEQSNDQGKTWTTAYDFTYRPQKAK